MWDQFKDLFHCLQVPETPTPRKLIFQHLSFPPLSAIYPTEVRGSPRSFATRLFSLGRAGSFSPSLASSNTADRYRATEGEGQQSASDTRQMDSSPGADRRDVGDTEDRKRQMFDPDWSRQEMVDKDELLYEAESPDEAALVHAAHVYGFTLRGRSAGHVLVDLPGNGSMLVQLLHILPFDSCRKRMSVVVRHPLSGEVVVYTKGADSVIMELSKHQKGKNSGFTGDVWCLSTYVSVFFSVLLLCSDGSHNQEVYSHIRKETQKHLDSYARDGLRTLCIAKKVTLKI